MISRRALVVAGAAAVAGCDRLWPKRGGEAPDAPAAPPSGAPTGTPAAGPPQAEPAGPPPLALELEGAAEQGGSIRGATAPKTKLSIGGAAFKANSEGRFLIGFDRDAPESLVLTAQAEDGRTAERTVAVAPRTFPTQNIGGVPRALGDVFPIDWFDLDEDIPEQATRSLGAAGRNEREQQMKAIAFASRADERGFAEQWRPPVKGRRISSQWGARRTMQTPNGVQEKTHYGVDIAAMVGVPIVAPASGLISLAEPDLYYEGGCVFIDHGQGLTSVYLHMSQVIAQRGQRVKAGDLIGKVGQSGRASGPHLCWRLKWLDTQIDPTLFVGGADALVDL